MSEARLHAIQALVTSILSTRGELPAAEVAQVLGAGGLHRFSLVFVHKTHATYSTAANHEVAEFRGDAIVNDVVGHYIVHEVDAAAPLRGVAHCNLLRQRMVSKEALARHAVTLGFDRVMAYNAGAPAFRRDPRLTRWGMLEDAFEAFLGTVATEYDRVVGGVGYGYTVAARVLRSLLGEAPMDTSLEAITPPKDRLKNVFNTLHWPLNAVMLRTAACPGGARADLYGFFSGAPEGGGGLPRPLQPLERRKLSHEHARRMGTMKETQRAELAEPPLRDLPVPPAVCFVGGVQGVDGKDAEAKAAEAGLRYLATFGYVPYPKEEEGGGDGAASPLPGTPPADPPEAGGGGRVRAALLAFGMREAMAREWGACPEVVALFRAALAGAARTPFSRMCEFAGETLLTAALCTTAAAVAPALPASEAWLTRFKHTVNSSKLFGRGLYHALDLASLGGAPGGWWEDTPAGRTDAVETFVGCIRHVLHTRYTPPYLHDPSCFSLVAQQVRGVLQTALRDGALVVSYQALFDPITRLRELFRQLGWRFSLHQVLPVWEEGPPPGARAPPPAPSSSERERPRRRLPLVRPARAQARLPGAWGIVAQQEGTSVQDARHRAAQAAIDALIAAGVIAEPAGLVRQYEVRDPQVRPPSRAAPAGTRRKGPRGGRRGGRTP